MRSRLAMAWWLGQRLLRGGWHRTALVTVGMSSMAATLVLLSVCTVPAVLRAQEEAEAALTVVDSTTATGVRIQDQRWDWKGDERIRVLVVMWSETGPSDDVHLPGIPHVPRPGEMYASTALLDDLSRDADLRRNFSFRRAGPIGADALPRASDRLAYVGMDASGRLEPGPDQRLGAGEPEFRTTSRSLLVLAVSTVLLFVALPIVMLSVSAFQLLAQPRRAQIALLTVIGVGARRARRLVALDGLVVGLLGCLIAVIVFQVAVRSITQLPLVPASWTVGQPRLTVAGITLSIASTTAAAWAVGRTPRRDTSSRGGSSRPSRPHRGQAPQPPTSNRRSLSRRPLDLTILALFVGVIVAVLLSRELVADETPATAAAVVALVVALAVVAPAVCRVMTRLAGESLLVRARRGATGVLVGARLARASGRRDSLVGLTVGAFVLAMTVGPLVAQVAPRDTLAADANAAAGRIVTLVQPGGREISARDLLAVPGTLAVVAPEHATRRTAPTTCSTVPPRNSFSAWTVAFLAARLELAIFHPTSR